MGQSPLNDAAALVSLHQRIQAAGPTDRSLAPLLKEYAPRLLRALGRDRSSMHDEQTIVGVPGLPNGHCAVTFYATADGFAGCFADEVQDDEGDEIPMDEHLRDLDLLSGDALARNPALHAWLQEIAHLQTKALHQPRYRFRIDDSDNRGIWEAIDPTLGRVAIDALAGCIYADLAEQARRIEAAKQPFMHYEWKDGRLVTKTRSPNMKAWMSREYRRAFREAMMPEGNDSTVVRVPSLDKAQLIAQQAEKIRQETPPPVIPTYIFHEWPGTTPLGAMAYYLAEAENGPRLTRRAAAECLGLDPAGNAIRDHLRRARAARQGAYKKALKALGQAKTPKGVAGVR